MKQSKKTMQHKTMQHKTTLLYTAVSIALAGVAQSAQAAIDDPDYKKIGDLEIYQRPEGGSVTLGMMLDTSGSMGLFPGAAGRNIDSVRDDYGFDCVTGSNPNTRDKSQKFRYTVPFTDAEGKVVPDTPNVTIELQGCTNNGQQYYSRLGRLQKSLIDLFADGTKLPTSYKVGLGNYSAYGANRHGMMAVPAKPLTVEHRKDIINYVKSLDDKGGTPTSTAYAEIGAYMMGTKTGNLSSDIKNVVIPTGLAKRTSTGLWKFSYCQTFADTNLTGKRKRDGFTWLECSAFIDAPTVPGVRDRNNLTDPKRYVSGFNNLFDYNAYSITDQAGNPTTFTNQRIAPYYVHYGKKFSSYWPDNGYSGFMFSHSSTKKPDQRSYQSPIDGNSQCAGHGIYFLTDGYPNRTPDKGAISAVMAASLQRNSFNPTNDLPTQGALSEIEGNSESGWEYIGAYAQELRKPNNPSGVEIKTATLGFGAEFTKNVDPATGKIENCNSLPTTDAKNLCKWGKELGGGGFTATSDPDIISRSIVEFAATLNKTIPSLPAGTISIPSDPLSADRIQPYAYLPMIQPEVAKSDSIWEGNLKKYDTLYGTLYGKNGKKLYQKANNPTKGNEKFAAQVDPSVQDLWQKNPAEDNSLVSVGGSRERLREPTPPVGNKTSRIVYVEGKAQGKNKPVLIKVQIENGKPKGFDKLLKAGYTFEEILYLTDYLGFPLSKDVGGYGASNAERLAGLTAKIQNAEKRPELVFGGVNHSVPVLAAYKAEFDDSGNATTDESKRTDYMLYGSMDGALHMTKVKDGEEAFSFIPRAIFDNQKEALVYGSKVAGVGQPFFGVDAPWDTLAKYNYNDTDGKETVVAEKMYAYGGLRMGGIGFYGLDIINENEPKLLFSIDDKKTGFERLGQTWAKPTKAKIKTGTQVKDVLIFGGGYDMCYENPKFKLNDADNGDINCQNKSEAKGNAIYMVDAKDGSLIKSWTTSYGDDSQHMKHSFVSEIVPLDRNNNGYVDSLYAADLGGQLFRIDLQEGAEPNAISRRLIRVFDANKSLATDTLPYRFYEKPAISFYDNQGSTLAMINIASGDRSSPIHKHRDSKEKANRIYGIIDRDLTTSKILSNKKPSEFISRNLDSSHLVAYDTEKLRTSSDAQRKAFMDSLKSGNKQGWYYDMTRFEDYTDVKHLKAVGSSIVTGNIYYTSIYSPDYQYTKGSSCSAKILGATERQGFCLPWGICASNEGKLIDGSKNGTLGYIKAGPGIQELALTTLTGKAGTSSNFKTFISPQTMLERNQASSTSASSNPVPPSDSSNAFGGKGVGRGEDHNKLYTDAVTSDNRILKIDRWYDLANVETK